MISLNLNDFTFVQLEPEAVLILKEYCLKNSSIVTKKLSEPASNPPLKSTGGYPWYKFQLYEFIKIFGHHIGDTTNSDPNKQIIKDFQIFVEKDI